MNSDGTGSYTPSGAYSGPDSFTFHVSNGTNTSATVTVNITVNPLSIDTASLPNGTLYVAYDQTLSVTHGPGALTFSVSAGALPDGLTLNTSSGEISGVPTNTNGGAAFNFTIKVTDTNNASTTHAYSVSMAAPTIIVSSAPLTPLQVGAGFSLQLSASGGLPGGAYTFTLGIGAIPAGLTLDPTGLLHGVPTVGGPLSFSIMATDATTTANGGPFSIKQAYTPTIAPPSQVLTPLDLSDGTVASPYDQIVSAIGGTEPYSLYGDFGRPPRRTVTQCEHRHDQRDADRRRQFRRHDHGHRCQHWHRPVQCLSSLLARRRRTYSHDRCNCIQRRHRDAGPIARPPRPQEAPRPIHSAKLERFPTGLVLDSNGTLHGTPTTEGTYVFTVTATDSSTGTGPYTAQANVSITVDFAPVFLSQPTANPNPATVDLDVEFSTTVTPADAAISWDFGDGSIGSGATPNHIYTVAGNYTVQVVAKNVRSNTPTSTSFVLQVLDAGAQSFLPGTTLILQTQGFVSFGRNVDQIIVRAFLPTTTFNSAKNATIALNFNGLTRNYAFDGRGRVIPGGDRATLRPFGQGAKQIEFYSNIRGALKSAAATGVSIDSLSRPKIAILKITANGTAFSSILPITYVNFAKGKFTSKPR